MIDLHPTKCNLCEGKVIYTTNDTIYGKQYGSGYCYLCTCCGAYVGTHKPYPKVALGILANAEMRELKMKAHSIFDKTWSNRKERNIAYKNLATKLNIPINECHFGYFDKDMLLKAINILEGKEER